MTVRGTIADINTAMNGMSYAPTANYAGAASLTILTDDRGFTGTPGALTDSDVVAITVNPVNDAPVNTVPAAQAVNEDAALVFSAGNANQVLIADLDAGASLVDVTLTVTNGTLTLAGTTGLAFQAGADGTGHHDRARHHRQHQHRDGRHELRPDGQLHRRGTASPSSPTTAASPAPPARSPTLTSWRSPSTR